MEPDLVEFFLWLAALGLFFTALGGLAMIVDGAFGVWKRWTK